MSTEWVVIPIRGKDRPDAARRLLAASPDPALVRVTGDGFKVPLTVAIDAGLVEAPDRPQEPAEETAALVAPAPPAEDTGEAPAAPSDEASDSSAAPAEKDELPVPKKTPAKKATS